MDRPTPRKDADARTLRIDLLGAFVPPSREPVLELALAALGRGPILLTGDAGIGKSWAVEQLIHQAPSGWWTRVDLTPADGPSDLYRHIARGLGMASGSPIPTSRLDIADLLADRSADGERHSLVIDEAHNLALDVWEEVRVLANRLGHADGFANLILVGQTVLIRRFSTRALAAIEARLASHIHLRPIDLDEAREWLARTHPGIDWSTDEVEAIHRDSGGNPGRLLRRSAAISARATDRGSVALPPEAKATALPHSTDLGVSGPTSRAESPPTNPPPLTGPDRPPLHFEVEENAIEVGWSTDEVEPSSFDDEDDQIEPSVPGGMTPRLDQTDQAVNDHYAALQAWREWADNQDKRAGTAKSDRAIADEIDEAAEAEAAEKSEATSNDRPSVRVEGQQHFAPFGQLFTRMPQVGEPGSPRS